MIAVVWQFDIHPGKDNEFEQFFGADGEWTAVSRHSRSYLGSSFLKDRNRKARYLIVEYWSEMLVYEQHKAYRLDQFAHLDARRDELVTSAEPVGMFTALNVPDRAGPTWSRRS